MEEAKSENQLSNEMICIFSINYWHNDPQNFICMHFFPFQDPSIPNTPWKCLLQYVVPNIVPAMTGITGIYTNGIKGYIGYLGQRLTGI